MSTAALRLANVSVAVSSSVQRRLAWTLSPARTLARSGSCDAATQKFCGTGTGGSWLAGTTNATASSSTRLASIG